ncbi:MULTISPECIES: 2-C-methyl-D-erythritol 4-phosphate cytidylyltransferase [unclassified Enterococcus]|uniref:2-C-methyl-D-erythritol 4-phosphate cytidylyltransferase n=1 Tax=unclassified Enterococcus TaxID=2608891 RepID=UPI001552335D|nr:2-C-methyl-D-erythritol 4-phosphate cytidylyltransferase [Enterococcus sp. MMGLQ5-2]MBS7585412.1 2-C-methyl-D-erythritol 4-phosphate cytidylyltransferase [Enterococcus sp. MMGLQ5-1]NPD13269.1 2-C-methyl-D-erythritol 4-phosphate cytidylyltransferase [Enterococcus sp. MMGLQ5-1]NPD38043.1 2-C-methyl-D-erythritol 4-phosphate cytidylyltransferase [Enterococcus sp. MMGLQ5-2]
MDYTAIVLAAGSGTRMGIKQNKVFLELKHQPIISYSIDLFLSDNDCKQIIVVGKADERENFPTLPREVEFIEGGLERQDSVRLGLAQTNCKYVMIHDGARPFITSENLEALKANVFENNATMLAVPVKDTIKQVRKGKIIRTVPRADLYQAQTPQVFLTEWIKKAHKKAEECQFLGTDDGSLIEAFLDAEVTITMGSYENIKITTPEDLVIAKAIMRRRRNV